MRIDKLLSHAGFGTRKSVKQLLKKKIVQVDGKIITKGDKQVNPAQSIIFVDDQKVVYKKYIYLMLHKPSGVVSATTDNRDRTVIDLVPTSYAHYEMAPVGRLDKDTEGLLLLTNDGQMNHTLTSPKKSVTKTYFAKIDGYVTEKEVEAFQDGVLLNDGYKTEPAILRILKQDDISEIELDITEGKFHQVKRMFQAVNMTVVYLKRIKMGPITLDEQLPIGKIRPLNDQEMKELNNINND